MPSRIEWPNTWTKSLHTPNNELPGYHIKQSDGEALEMLELWRILSTSSLPLLPGPLWSGVVAPDRVSFMDQTEQFDI